MKENTYSKNKIIKCLHCGNETPMEKVGEYSWGSRDIEYTELEFFYKYEMFACPICHKVSLLETYGDESMINYYNNDEISWYDRTETIYPINGIEDEAVPLKIREAYEAALKTKGIDIHICLMALRRTLELILTDKGAEKWGLQSKIEEIAEKGLLPGSLKEASSLAKILGDSAAHDKNDIEIENFDVDAIAEFIGYIIEYIYIVPEKIVRYKRLIDARKDE